MTSYDKFWMVSLLIMTTLWMPLASTIKTFPMYEKILLHQCCGPCSLFPIKILKSTGFDVTGFFYNPNIHPIFELYRRLENTLVVNNYYGIKGILMKHMVYMIFPIQRCRKEEKVFLLLRYQNKKNSRVCTIKWV